MNRRAFMVSTFVGALSAVWLRPRRAKPAPRNRVTVGPGHDHATVKGAVAEVCAAGGGIVFIMPGVREGIYSKVEWHATLNARSSWVPWESSGV